MKFTAKELQQIEQTMDKLVTASTALLSRESSDFANVRALSYIVGELRLAAHLMQDEDIQIQQGGLQRALNIFANI
jgi:hypothetical protein